MYLTFALTAQSGQRFENSTPPSFYSIGAECLLSVRDAISIPPTLKGGEEGRRMEGETEKRKGKRREQKEAR